VERFYRPDHPSGGVRTTVAIIAAFVKDAECTGRVPVVAFFPTREGLEFYLAHGEWAHKPLFDELCLQGIPYFDQGQYILRVRSKASLPLLFQRDGHPSAEGYRLQAEGVHHHLVERGLVRPS
jgi:hypothetical protein